MERTQIMEDIITKLQEWVALFGLQIIGAIVIIVVGLWGAKVVKRIITKLLTKRNVEGTIISFVTNLTHIAIVTFVIITAIGRLGIQTASFAAAIAAAGLAIGLALQGSLANFAAGFLLLFFRPFKKGDYIEGAGVAGIVNEIQVFTTILTTPDNKKIIIPNSKLTGDNIINYSATGTRRIELVIGVSYADDLDKVRSVLQNIVDHEARVMKEPASMIAVKELADSSVNFVLRVWVKTEDYWDVFFDTTEAVKKRLDEAGIRIPFPQRDVHIYEHKV
jgi:small conductance mechanosensitive channel